MGEALLHLVVWEVEAVFIVFLQSLYGQSLEQFLFPLKVGVDRGEEEALAEAPRTAQEVAFPFRHQSVHMRCLVDVGEIVFTNILKRLYSNWILHFIWIFSSIVSRTREAPIRSAQ